MQSGICKIINLLETDKFFQVNKFSSEYNFDAQNAQEFFNNLISNDEDSPVFSGIIILRKLGDKYVITDGCQRLTTLNLFLAALCGILKNLDDSSCKIEEKIMVSCLLKSDMPKLWLNEQDNTAYKKIILEQPLTDDDEISQVCETYNAFLKLLEQRAEDINKIIKIFFQLHYLVIITKESEIPTRELYQYFNDISSETHIKLISDLLEKKGSQVQKIWQDVLLLFNASPNRPESFLKDFLVASLDEDEIFDRNNLYANFKKYYYKLAKFRKPKEILNNIYKYAKYYLKLANESFSNKDIKEQINILNTNSGRETYPYLMEVMDDYENGHISESALLNLLTMVNVFIKSRNENSLQEQKLDFSQLSKELNKMLVIKDYVPEIISDNKLTINQINNLSDFEV